VAVLIAGVTGRFDPFNGLNSTLLFVFLFFLSMAGIVNTVKQGIVFNFYASQAIAICHSLGLICKEGAYGAPLYRNFSDELETSRLVRVGYWIMGIYLVSLWVITTIILESVVGWKLVYTATSGILSPTIIGLIAYKYMNNRLDEIEDHKGKFEDGLKESIAETNSNEA
jgi:hypothetical protein